MTFRNLCGLTFRNKSPAAEPLKTFGELSKRLLSKYIMNQVMLDLAVSEDKVKGAGMKSLVGTLQPTCEKLARDIELPYFIWNAETRKEMAQVLEKQVALVLSKARVDDEYFTKALAEFEYAAYRNELIVDGVFVKMINKDPYMRVEEPFDFIIAAVQELDKSLAAVKDLEQNKPELDKVVSLLDAINNLVIYQKGFELGSLPQPAVKTLCKFVPFTEVLSKPAEQVCSYVFSIFLEAAKEPKQVLSLVDCEDFCKTLLHILCNPTKNDFLVKRAMGCLEGIAGGCDQTLMSRGFVVVLLRILFDEACPKPHRVGSFRVVQGVLSRQRADDKASYFACFVPKHMLERITEQSGANEEDSAASLLKDQADIYLTWNAELRAKTMEALLAETKKVEEWATEPGRPVWIDIPKEPVIEQYVNRGEVVVAEVVLSRYISFPVAKLKVPLLSEH